jgi:phosphate transport system substrate-binding protein
MISNSLVKEGTVDQFFKLHQWTAVVVLALLTTGCGGDGASPESESIRVDGSSTVFPISMAVAEEFRTDHPNVKVPVRASGTGGGMKQFSVGDIDICNASREMTESEQEICDKNKIEYVALKVAFDGLAVVVNPANDWCDCITVEQLKSIWRPESDGTITKWSDVNPDWPDEELKLYGPGTDSGTFDYFTEVICGEARSSRADYTASENDNALVRGVVADKGALGYFGIAYYSENKDELKLLAVDSGEGCIVPSEATVRDGTYEPLARPLLIYVNKKSLERPEVAEFVKFYMANAAKQSAEVGYVPVTDEVAAENQKLLDEALPKSETVAAK